MLIFGYLNMIIVGSFQKINLEISSPRKTTASFVLVTFYFDWLWTASFWTALFLILIDAPVSYCCFWGMKFLESKSLIYWWMFLGISSIILIYIL